MLEELTNEMREQVQNDLDLPIETETKDKREVDHAKMSGDGGEFI